MYTKNIEEFVNSYCHDAFFHYLVSRHDEIRRILCQKMIRDRIIISTTVENSSLYGNNHREKKYILDIVAKDEKGDIYNIEMQCYNINEAEMKRMQVYGFRLADQESQKGDDYRKIKPVRQMVINNDYPIKGLKEYIHQFRFYDYENNISLPYHLSEITIVQLAYLDMNKENIDVFDQLMYLFKNSYAYDKIKIDKNIKEAIHMHEQYMNSDERILALERERDRIAYNTMINIYNEGKENMNKLKEEYNDLILKQEEMKKQYNELNNKKEETEKQYNELNNKKEETEKQFNELSNKKEETQKQFAELNDKKEETQKELKYLTSEKEDIEKELEKIRLEVEKAKKELNQLKNNLYD